VMWWMPALRMGNWKAKG